MRRETRNYIAIACIALFAASFSSHLWLFLKYQSIRPTQPHPELGFLHALNNHGTYVYITDAEATGMSLLFLMCFLAFGLAFSIVPKKYILSGIEHDLTSPSREQVRVFWIAIVCYLALIAFVGPYFVAFAVSHGLVIVM
jgi:hypothetical protein